MTKQMIVAVWVGLGVFLASELVAAAAEVPAGQQPPEVVLEHLAEVLASAEAKACGPTLSAVDQGFGTTCTAALQNLTANVLATVQDTCTGVGVCSVGRLGILVGCRPAAGGGLVVDGQLNFACNAE